MRKNLRIYVDHGEAYGNLGDEVMLLNALARLERHLGRCEFVLPCQPERPLPLQLRNVTLVPPPRITIAKWARYLSIPFALARHIPLLGRLLPIPHDSTFWRWAVKCLNVRLIFSGLGILRSLNKDLEPFMHAIQACDVFYGVGAADFNDYWLQGVVYKCWLYTVVRPYVRVSAVSSQGIGPLSTAWARRMMGKAFSKLDLVSFRDHSLSQSIVEKEHPTHVRYKVVGDEAFTLPPSDGDEARALLSESGLPEKTSFIAFHFRTTDYTQDTSYLIPRVARILDQIAEAVPHLVVFFPMSYHIHSRFDEECGRAIQEKMSRNERLFLAPLCRDVRVIKAAVGMSRYSLGLSYHIHVFSLSQGHPAVILYTGDYYKCKSEGLIGFYGAPSVAINLRETDDSRVIDAIMKIENSYDNSCEAINHVNKELLKCNDWMVQEMATLLRIEMGDNERGDSAINS